jgi:hypothetical protein
MAVIDIARRAPQHLLGGEPDLLDDLLAVRAAFLPDRHHGRLVEHDALAVNIDQGIRRAQVDGEVVGKVAV